MERSDALGEPQRRHRQHRHQCEQHLPTGMLYHCRHEAHADSADQPLSGHIERQRARRLAAAPHGGIADTGNQAFPQTRRETHRGHIGEVRADHREAVRTDHGHRAGNDHRSPGPATGEHRTEHAAQCNAPHVRRGHVTGALEPKTKLVGHHAHHHGQHRRQRRRRNPHVNGCPERTGHGLAHATQPAAYAISCNGRIHRGYPRIRVPPGSMGACRNTRQLRRSPRMVTDKSPCSSGTPDCRYPMARLVPAQWP
jgi:hypothetical protein